MLNLTGITTQYSLEEIRLLVARAYLFGIRDFSPEQKNALKEIGVLTEESSIGGAMGAIFTPAGLDLAHSVAQQYCADAERTYRSLR